MNQILLKVGFSMSKKAKTIIIVILTLAIVLTCFFKFIYPKAALYWALNKFEFDFYTESKIISIEYKEPTKPLAASGLVFDNSMFNLSPKYGDKPLPEDISVYNNADITLICTGLDEQAKFEILLDMGDEESSSAMQGILERNNIRSYADFEFAARSFNVSDYSFLDFLTLSQPEASDAVVFAGTKYNMTPRGYTEHKCYDINNSKMRFIVEKTQDIENGNTFLVAAYCIDDGITTDTNYNFSIFDEKCVLTDEQVIDFLASVAVDLNE